MVKCNIFQQRILLCQYLNSLSCQYFYQLSHMRKIMISTHGISYIWCLSGGANSFTYCDGRVVICYVVRALQKYHCVCVSDPPKLCTFKGSDAGVAISLEGLDNISYLGSDAPKSSLSLLTFSISWIWVFDAAFRLCIFSFFPNIP